MGLIRSALSLAFLGLFLLVGFTVPIGQRTLFGHVGNIWASNEAQELVDGVKDSSGPLVDRVKRGVEAGLNEAPATDETSVPVAPNSQVESVGETIVGPEGEGVSPVATTETPTPGGDSAQ